MGTSARRRAVLVGLNYHGLPPAWKIPELFGCINDVFNMATLLQECYGFDPAEIRAVVDSDPVTKPTRTTVLQSIEWLCDGVRSGDSLFFYYAGHGSTLKVPGSQQRYDFSCLCLIDDLVLMSEIQGRFGSLAQGTKIICVMDTSFGQDVLDLSARTLDGDGPAEVSPMECVRWLPPRRPPAWFDPRVHVPTAGGRDSLEAEGFTIAACGRRQVAIESFDSQSGKAAGLFSSVFAVAVRSFPGRPVLVHTLFERILKLTKALFFRENLEDPGQVPMLAFSYGAPPGDCTWMLPATAYVDMEIVSEWIAPVEDTARTPMASARSGKSTARLAAAEIDPADAAAVKHIQVIAALPRRPFDERIIDIRRSEDAVAAEEKIEQGVQGIVVVTADQEAALQAAQKARQEAAAPLPPGQTKLYSDAPMDCICSTEVLVRNGAELDSTHMASLPEQCEVRVGPRRALIVNEAGEQIERACLEAPIEGWVSLHTLAPKVAERVDCSPTVTPSFPGRSPAAVASPGGMRPQGGRSLIIHPSQMRPAMGMSMPFAVQAGGSPQWRPAPSMPYMGTSPLNQRPPAFPGGGSPVSASRSNANLGTIRPPTLPGPVISGTPPPGVSQRPVFQQQPPTVPRVAGPQIQGQQASVSPSSPWQQVAAPVPTPPTTSGGGAPLQIRDAAGGTLPARLSSPDWMQAASPMRSASPGTHRSWAVDRPTPPATARAGTATFVIPSVPGSSDMQEVLRASPSPPPAAGGYALNNSQQSNSQPRTPPRRPQPATPKTAVQMQGAPSTMVSMLPTRLAAPATVGTLLPAPRPAPAPQAQEDTGAGLTMPPSMLRPSQAVIAQS